MCDGFMRLCLDEYTDYNSNNLSNYTNITKQRMNPKYDDNKEIIFNDINILSQLNLKKDELFDKMRRNVSKIMH